MDGEKVCLNCLFSNNILDTCTKYRPGSWYWWPHKFFWSSRDQTCSPEPSPKSTLIFTGGLDLLPSLFFRPHSCCLCAEEHRYSPSSTFKYIIYKGIQYLMHIIIHGKWLFLSLLSCPPSFTQSPPKKLFPHFAHWFPPYIVLIQWDQNYNIKRNN